MNKYFYKNNKNEYIDLSQFYMFTIENYKDCSMVVGYLICNAPRREIERFTHPSDCISFITRIIKELE